MPENVTTAGGSGTGMSCTANFYTAYGLKGKTFAMNTGSQMWNGSQPRYWQVHLGSWWSTGVGSSRGGYRCLMQNNLHPQALGWLVVVQACARQLAHLPVLTLISHH